MAKPKLILILFFLIPLEIWAQDPNLLDMLDKDVKAKPATDYAQ